MQLNTIIVEDEPLSRQYLGSLLAGFCPQVKVAGSAASEKEAVALIEENKPDLLFLDIELTTGTGFDVLKSVAAPPPHIVFTTALDHRATNLIRLCGVHYLQKPIDLEELQALVREAAAGDGKEEAGIRHLLQALHCHETPVHIAIPVVGTVIYVCMSDIVLLEAQALETTVVLQDGNTYTATRDIKEWETLLKDFGFFRVHQQHLVNLQWVRAASSESVQVKDITVALSPRKREAFNEQWQIFRSRL